MNAQDPWAAFAEVFADELKTATEWTPEMCEAFREEYERAQIATANSEQAQAAAQQEYSNAAHQR